MKTITNILDRVFTPLRLKLFKVITSEDLHEDHVALDNKTNDVNARFKRCGDKHVTIKTNLDLLDEEHGGLEGQIADFHKQIPGILADVKRRIKEHQAFSRKILEISKKTDGIESKLDYICKFLRRLG